MPLRALLVALVGSVAVAALVGAARRFAVADRLRPSAAGRVLPAVVRDPLARALEDAALTSTPEQAVQMWMLAIGIAALVGSGLSPVVGILGAIAVAVCGPGALRIGRHRRDRQIAAAVPDTLERIGSELRAGGTVTTALTTVAHGDGVLAGDALRIERRVRLGSGLPEALRSWSRERRAVGVEVAAGALSLSASVGGPAADALDGLASSLRARLSVIAEARALSAQARYSAWVIGLAPVGYFVITAAVDSRSVHVLVGTTAGRMCVLAGLGLELLGAAWMRAIVGSGRRGVIALIALACGGVAALPFVRMARRELVVVRVRPLSTPSIPRRGRFERLRRELRRNPFVASVVRVANAPRRARRRERSRADRLRRELPVVVDLVGVAVAAGCTPFHAVEHATRFGPCHTAAALRGVVQGCTRGQSFDDAMRDLGASAATLCPLTDALRTSARLGTPAAPALTRLATEVRADVRRRAEARARTVPVRLCFPLVVCVLPAFALLTVVPAVLSGFQS